MTNSTDALTGEQVSDTLQQQADGTSQSSENALNDQPTTLKIGERELTMEEAQKALSIYEGYTQKFQALAEERNQLQSEKEMYDRFRQFQELSQTPDGAQQIIEYLAQEHGLTAPAETPAWDGYEDDATAPLRAELAQVRAELAKMHKAFEPVVKNHAQTQEMARAEQAASQLFGQPITFAQMQAAMGATGIKDPIGAYAAWELQQQKPVIDAARARTQPPVTPGGVNQKTFRITPEMTGADVVQMLEQGFVPEE